MADFDRTEFYIDGQWVAPATAKKLEIIDPSTEGPCGTISLGSAVDVDRAVRAARKAFPLWASTPHAERRALVEELGKVMRSRIKELSEAISFEMGAPIDFATNDQAACGPWHLKGFLKAFDRFEWEREFTAREKIVHEPIGVVGLITPWNWPVNQIALKMIPAVLIGNTCVLKPSEIAPLSAMVWADFMQEAGFPAGVFNLVNGDGPTVGEAMSAHWDIDMMSFTGSLRGGAAVMKGSAATAKKVTLELGGKSPNIIFADANVEKAVRGGVVHCMENTGQSCNAPTRMIVERDVYDEAVAIATDEAEKTRVGNPRDNGAHIGPLVSQAQYDKVQSLIEIGLAEGARCVAGGIGRPEGFNRGYFARPTVFADVSNDMRIAREEVFGPVLAMIPFDGGEEEAIQIANDTDYGLAAYLHTNDAEKGERVGRALRAGMVRVNGAAFSMGHPFGGYKQSGVGREGGIWGLEDFCETKILAQKYD
ncbi:MAG: aldehyde dehydrogenase family protein [Pseudomonadota bacterium]